MSLESALDEEMRDVVALLEGRKLKPTERQSSRVRAISPTGATQSPVRSMLDVGNSMPLGRHASIAGTSMAGVTSPSGSHFGGSSIRSMLDTTSSPPQSPGPMQRAHRPSHGSASPPAIGRALSGGNKKPEDAYNFEMLPSIESQAMPKRVAQGGKKKPGAMAGIFGAPPETGKMSEARKQSVLGRAPASVSPARRSLGRSQSPAARLLNNNSMNLHTNPGTYVSDNGQVIDLASAYRRLSDAALLKSGGRLSSLPTRRKSNNIAKGEELAPDGGVRLTKDYDDDDVVESSDEESGSSDEEWNVNRRRGRDRTRKGSGSALDDDRPSAKSLLGAAEEEREY